MTPDLTSDMNQPSADDTDTAALHDASSQPRGGRRRGVISMAALVGSACTVGAAFTPWWRRVYDDPLTGQVTVSLSGSHILAALVPVALVALAGLGAVLMTRGLLQRLLGLLLLIAGVGVAVWSIIGMVVVPNEALSEQLQRPAEPMTGATTALAGQLLGIVGGLLIALAGAVVAAVGATSAARGTAYDSPAAQRERMRRRAAISETGAPSSQVDVTEAGSEWWRALDAGMDPTEAGTDSTGAGTGSTDAEGLTAHGHDASDA